MKKLIATVSLIAFAVAVQAGDTCCSKTKTSITADSSGCCSKTMTSAQAGGCCSSKTMTSTQAGGCCSSKTMTSTQANGACCSKTMTGMQADGSCCSGHVMAKRTLVARALLSPKAAAAL